MWIFMLETPSKRCILKVHYFYLLSPHQEWKHIRRQFYLDCRCVCSFSFSSVCVCVCRQWKWKVECISKHMLNNIDFLTYSYISIDTSNDERIDLVFASFFFLLSRWAGLKYVRFFLAEIFALKWKFPKWNMCSDLMSF